jgi:hypothetical protein
MYVDRVEQWSLRRRRLDRVRVLDFGWLLLTGDLFRLSFVAFFNHDVCFVSGYRSFWSLVWPYPIH